MKLFHRHKWTPWKPIILRGTDRHGTYMTEEQERRCTSCGLTKRKGFW